MGKLKSKSRYLPCLGPLQPPHRLRTKDLSHRICQKCQTEIVRQNLSKRMTSELSVRELAPSLRVE